MHDGIAQTPKITTDENGYIITSGTNAQKGTITINGEPWAIQFALTRLGRDRGYTEKPADDKPATEGQVPVDVVTAIIAALRARQPQPVGPGGAVQSDAVVPEPGCAEPSVPLGSG